MIEKILSFFLILSVSMMVLGFDEFFTTTFPDKWYPGMNYRFTSLIPFFPLSDKTSKKLFSWGFALLMLTIFAFVGLNALGFTVYTK